MQPTIEQPVVSQAPSMSRFERIKKLVIQVLVISLVASAVVAVAAVLIGQITDTFWRTLMTLGLVMIHALASLAYVRTADQSHDVDDLTFFSNSVFVIIALSFVTSVFGVWNLLGDSLVWKLYATYFVLLFAALHGELLSKTTKLESYISNLVFANYGFMLLVIGLLLPVIYLGSGGFSGFYYRSLAAAGIVDATLSILVVIFHRLYLQKHPKQPSQLFGVDGSTPSPGAATPAKRHINPLLLLLGVYILGQIVVSIIIGVAGNFQTPY